MNAPADAGATYVKSAALMGTVVSMQVIGHHSSQRARRERRIAVDNAFAWFKRVEATCSRFDAGSELRRLCATSGQAVPVSDMLFEAMQFAVAVADATNGAFDPTVGQRMEARGFDRDYRSGKRARSEVETQDVSWRDLALDDAARTITLSRSLLLDLGAVAKGLAVDMAARELAPFTDFAIDAGGDLFLGGHNADGNVWSVGIRNPRDPAQLIESVSVSNRALCTSGGYERPMVDTSSNAIDAPDGEHHILNPATGTSPSDVASVTVIAPSAMVADALATAAFVLGPRNGLSFLEQHDVDGIIVTPDLERIATRPRD